MNFTSELIIRNVGQWGYLTKTGWNGMIGDVLSGDVDFIAAPLAMNLIRFKVVDYLHILGTETVGVYIPMKGLEEQAWMSFLYPLTTGVWVFLLLNAIVMLVVYKYFQLIKNRKGLLNRPKFQVITDAVRDFLMLATSYFGRSNSSKEVGSTQIRILLFAVFFSGMLVFVAYVHR